MTDQQQHQPDVPQLELTDQGLETPEHLVGTTRTVTVEKPNITLRVNPTDLGLAEYEDHLLSFPTDDLPEFGDVPAGYVKIDGQLYEVVDERSIQECPHCGSDMVGTQSTPKHCFSCDRDVAMADGGESDQYLKFANHGVGRVIDGEEDATVRYNLEREFQPGDHVKLVTPNENVFATAEIEDVWESELRHAYFDMVVADDRNHPATGALDLQDRLRFHYHDIEVTLEDEVTVVCFDVLQVGGATPA